MTPARNPATTTTTLAATTSAFGSRSVTAVSSPPRASWSSHVSILAARAALPGPGRCSRRDQRSPSIRNEDVNRATRVQPSTPRARAHCIIQKFGADYPVLLCPGSNVRNHASDSVGYTARRLVLIPMPERLAPNAVGGAPGLWSGSLRWMPIRNRVERHEDDASIARSTVPTGGIRSLDC